MSSPFQPQASGDYWFRVGKLHVTSTMLVVLLGAIGALACTFSGDLRLALYFDASSLFQLQFWRIVTWPLAGELTIWSLLTFLMLWYFGSMLESNLGRDRMMRLYVTIWATLTVTTGIFGLVLTTVGGLAGVGQVQFLILLLWIAEFPRARFFFNIPAWVFGAFILGLQTLQMLVMGAWGALIATAVSLVFVALGARRVGLLSAYDWLPSGAPRPQRTRSHAAQQPAAPSRQERRRASDEERLDQLLAKISAEGIHSLTKRERKELEELRLRRRQG
ncbi:DUF6576 domain-containing protein [Tessaracoccus caeni]|uniref:DUF6576 domain-containing protein n=1 Tax=Tessaracoccus caeni TaxID=3031239 RepID=UPI0023DCB19B|nr:DUF6576 domain-containing protein [Tessaracoccus caeni]MDF1489117.1 hypothetical protein [Tessaracoccus caeni]